jgi:hypothetical protein
MHIPDNLTCEYILRIADTGPADLVHSTSIAMEIDGLIYRLDYWTEAQWDLIPEASRPVAKRAHIGEGWFSLSCRDSSRGSPGPSPSPSPAPAPG